jgi:hypothetical protein
MLWISVLVGACVFIGSNKAQAEQWEEKTVYARCNLTAPRGAIGPNNYLEFPPAIKAGARCRLTRVWTPQGRAGQDGLAISDQLYGVEVVDTGRKYEFDAGTAGQLNLEKYFLESPPSEITAMAEQGNKLSALVKDGMSKEQVYAALGPPWHIYRNSDFEATGSVPYAKILASNYWVYAATRWQKLVVSFERGTGIVDCVGRTAGKQQCQPHE